MRYLNKTIGFSFELPEGWRHDKDNLTLTFLGPNGRLGYSFELIQMKFGPIQSPYMDAAEREKYLAEPGASISRSQLGDETNVVVLEKPDESEISAVHDGVHYIIAYCHDEATKMAIEKIKKTFSFPTIEEATDAIRRSENPRLKLIYKAIYSGLEEKNDRQTNKIAKPAPSKIWADQKQVMQQAEKAGKLWRSGDISEARNIYQELVNFVELPLDRAKLLSNIAQIYEKEGNIEKAIDTANESIQYINEKKIYESLEGSHLVGFLNGFVNRLKGKERWNAPEYDESIPLERNLSIPDRILVHLSVAIIGAGISSTIISQIPALKYSFFGPTGNVLILWIIGFIIGAMISSNVFEQFLDFYMRMSNRPIKYSLKPAVKLLSFLGFIYLVLMPFLFKDLFKEIISFSLFGLIGLVFFKIFIFKKHAKRIK